VSAVVSSRVSSGPSIPLQVPALSVQGVSKSFEKRGLRRRMPWALARADTPGRVMAIEGVSLDVHRGEIFGVLGANGSGKSTLIRLISTLLLADAGTIRVFGMDLARDELSIRRLINRVSADAAFFKKLSPMENLAYAARLYGLNMAVAREQAFQILERLGIARKTAVKPMEHMSRGMQQKVAIARALLTSPVLLLLDEPTTGLDPRSKKDVQEFVLEMRAQHDATVLLTTHDMEEADRMCDRIAVLNRGRVISLDTPANLRARHSSDGRQASLEDVFMHLTGLTMDDVAVEKEEDT
jgi:ABC-2 type transport system ATP-binding protein